MKNIFEAKQLVCSRQCDQCLFSKDKIVSNKRAKEVLGQCAKEQTHFICHKGSIAGKNVVCRGFFDNKSTPFLEIMKATGNIEFVDPFELVEQQGNNLPYPKSSRQKRKGL